MRLIDADKLLILETVAFNKAQAKTSDKITRLVNEVVHKKLQMLVSDAPTAYDVDKVVEQINDKIQNLDNKNKICMDVGDFRASDRLSDKMCAYIDCRKIVKRGGK